MGLDSIDLGLNLRHRRKMLVAFLELLLDEATVHKHGIFACHWQCPEKVDPAHS